MPTLELSIPNANWRAVKARAQRRDRRGRFAEMGGLFSFDFNLPGGGTKKVTGTVVRFSGTQDVDVEIKGDPDIPDGIYTTPSKSGENVKAIVDLDKSPAPESAPAPKASDDDNWWELPSDKSSKEKAPDPEPEKPAAEKSGYDRAEAMKPLEEYGAASDVGMDDELIGAVLEKVDLGDPALSLTRIADDGTVVATSYDKFDQKAQEIWTSLSLMDTRSVRYAEALDRFYSFIDSPASDDMPDVAKKLAGTEGMTAKAARDRHAKAAISALLIQKARDRASTKSPEKIKEDGADLVERVKSQPVVLNYSPESIGVILDSGRIKSQFETGHGTWFDPQGRAFSEAVTSGVPISTPDAQRPIYGTIAVDGVDSYSAETRAYGGVRLVFKDSVKDRTTVTSGDSFERRHVGSPARNPDPTLFPKSDSESGYQFYVEAQILGGVPIEDIEEIVLTDDGVADISERGAAFREVIAKADALGIKTRFLAIDNNHKTTSLTREQYLARLDAFRDGKEPPALPSADDATPAAQPVAQRSVQLTPTDDLNEAMTTGRPLRILQRGSYPQPVQEQYDKIKEAYTVSFAPEDAKNMWADLRWKIKDEYTKAGFTEEQTQVISNAIQEQLEEYASSMMLLETMKESTDERYVKNNYGEEVKLQRVTERLKDASVAISVQIDVLEKILADGRFKSQFESKSSRGALNPAARTKGDISQLGYHPDTDPTKRPIYGYLTSGGKIDDDSMASIKQYGQVQLLLKKDVEGRTTYTADDSLTFTTLQPAPFGVPSAAATQSVSPSYTEAQIHGGVSVEDVDYAVVQVGVPDEYNWRDNKITEEQFAQVEKILSAAGIRVIPVRDGQIFDTTTGTVVDAPPIPEQPKPEEIRQ